MLPSLPIADMLGGLTGAIAVMLALRDRARHGGSYHCDTALTSVDTIQLLEEVGCYPPEVVKKIQDTYNFGPQTPDLHVEELLFVVADAWQKKTDLLKRKEYYAHFAESPFGKDHVILVNMPNTLSMMPEADLSDRVPWSDTTTQVSHHTGSILQSLICITRMCNGLINNRIYSKMDLR